ncbi:helix-turn-helix transcriptional regulator [Endozoicomonas sp. SM1973]|uniref:Helix-turn-helix transcriptional regulator n=1 Tax=Spartinivicinus marinus TaxID=2994442 RepID=A0A853IIN0_9GAMM|nr:helix-turn-helix transcriptional regulator [Spartinivicinus marinus]MCX4027901.1 helix-turn-helix transcriptional regulator [Spartinivicinus marinus]NYZ69931.1 helix-turn-helix transcriptional regulator [Spartinivicinus marinus]
MINLFEKIKEARVRAELTQEELAEMCGVNRATVCQWESKDPTKRLKPRKANLHKISQATGVSLNWLKSRSEQVHDNRYLDIESELEKEVLSLRQEQKEKAKKAVQDLYAMVVNDELNSDEISAIVVLARVLGNK